MKKISKILLSVLVLIEPFLDTYFIYNSPLEIFGFKISTIIRYGLLLAIIIMLFIDTRFKDKRKLIICYIIFLLIYIGLHHYAAVNFKSLVPGDFNYSFIEELLYISRYLFPLIIIYYIYTDEITEKNFKRVLVIFSLIVSLSTIISNIFLLSKSSYYEFNISYNIFDWFVKDINFSGASTRGFFYSSIVMTILLLITPYIYYLYYKEKKYIYLTAIVCNMLSLFMTGTKACTFGFIIVAICMLIIYIFFTLIKKELKIDVGQLLASIFIIGFCFGILPKTPAMQRINLNNKIFGDEEKTTVNISNETDNTNQDDSENKDTINKNETSNKNEKNNNNINNNNNNNNNKNENENTNNEIDKDNTITTEELPNIDRNNYTNFNEIYTITDVNERESAIKKYINEKYPELRITPRFYTSAYPYIYDYNFWTDIILNTSKKQQADNRYIVSKIFDRIKKVNNSPIDDIFGISYSRTSKVFNLERDVVYQYYSLGIVGVVLLLGPIFLLLFSCIIRMLIRRDEYLTLENTSLCLGVGLLLCVAIYSGNMLDNLGISIVLGYVLGYLCNRFFKRKTIA